MSSSVERAPDAELFSLLSWALLNKSVSVASALAPGVMIVLSVGSGSGIPVVSGAPVVCARQMFHRVPWEKHRSAPGIGCVGELAWLHKGPPSYLGARHAGNRPTPR